MTDWILNFTRGGTKDKKLMPQQARKLLEAGLWGVPPTAQAKDKLQPGDRALIYVGAPDRVFLGEAIIASGWHPWTPDEAATYPGDFSAGIRLSDCHSWTKSLPLDAVWPHAQGAKTNPNARWYGAMARLSGSDFELIRNAGLKASPDLEEQPSPTPSAPSATPTAPAVPGDAQPPAHEPSSPGLPESASLFDTAMSLREYHGNPKPLNEDGTRAFFINKWLNALGYSGFEDIEYGSAVSSGDFPDYILHSGGKAVMAVEAKRIGGKLGPKEAAQLVKYTSVLGLRWGLLTDGQYLHVYDVPVTGIAPEDRLVLSIDLADFADRDDFDSRIWPAANLLTKKAMASGDSLERHAARELIRTVLSNPKSQAVTALKADLEQRKVHLSADEISALVEELIG